MIDFISSWTQGIIVAVIVATIMEMIIPEGNSKKYIKVVIGVYVLFTIVAPIINKVSNGEINLSTIIDVEAHSKQVEGNSKTIQNINTDNTTNIKELYINNLKKDIKSKIEDKSYKVNNIEIQIEDNEEYTIKSIYLKLSKKEEIEEKSTSNIIEIEEVNIRITNEENLTEENTSLSENEKKQLKEYLTEVYSVKNITIN